MRASWAPGASQNCFQSPPGPQKNPCSRPGAARSDSRALFHRKINLAIMEREAREARERQALRATQEQREQQEGQEQERQHLEEQQRTSGKSSPSINSASVYYRLGRENDEEQQSQSDQSLNTASVYYRVNPLCPCSPAARSRRALGAGSAAVASLILNMCRKSRSEKAPQ